jgi:hypothetical protein
MGRLVFGSGATIRGGIVVMACVARAFSIHVVVAPRASDGPTLRLLG